VNLFASEPFVMVAGQSMNRMSFRHELRSVGLT
jgi:hypothetical protein